jgi:hypothetical protein
MKYATGVGVYAPLSDFSVTIELRDLFNPSRFRSATTDSNGNFSVTITTFSKTSSYNVESRRNMGKWKQLCQQRYSQLKLKS